MKLKENDLILIDQWYDVFPMVVLVVAVFPDCIRVKHIIGLGKDMGYIEFGVEYQRVLGKVGIYKEGKNFINKDYDPFRPQRQEDRKKRQKTGYL